MTLLVKNPPLLLLLLLFFLSINGASMADIKAPMTGAANPDPSLPPPSPPHSSFNITCPLSYPIPSSLFFEDCNPHYSLGLMILSFIYLLFAMIYLKTLKSWDSIFRRIQPCFRKIHFLIGRLLAIKLLSLICAVVDIYYGIVTGVVQGSGLLFRVRQLIGVLRLVIAIQLIGKGLPIVKPFLQGFDKVLLLVMIPNEVLGTVISIMIGGAGRDDGFWNEALWTEDLISPAVWFISTFCEGLSIMGIAKKMSSRLQIIRMLYVMISVYLRCDRSSARVRNDIEYQVSPTYAYLVYLLMWNAFMELTGLVAYSVICRLLRGYFDEEKKVHPNGW